MPTKRYLRDTQSEPGTTGTPGALLSVLDLSITQGTPVALESGNLAGSSNYNTIPAKSWTMTVGAGPILDGTQNYGVSYQITASTDELLVKCRLRRVNSSGVAQATSGFGTEHSAGGGDVIGIWTDTINFAAGTWVAGDRLVFDLHGQDDGPGSQNFTLSVNDADSWVETVDGTPGIYTATGALATGNAETDGDATHTIPVFTGVCGVTTGDAVVVASASFTIPTRTAAGAPATGDVVASGSATYLSPTRTASGDLTSGNAEVAGSVDVDNPATTRTASGDLEASTGDIGGTALVANLIAAGTLTTGDATLVGAAVNDTPDYTATGALTTGTAAFVGTASNEPRMIGAGVFTVGAVGVGGIAIYRSLSIFGGDLITGDAAAVGAVAFIPYAVIASVALVASGAESAGLVIVTPPAAGRTVSGALVARAAGVGGGTVNIPPATRTASGFAMAGGASVAGSGVMTGPAALRTAAGTLGAARATVAGAGIVARETYAASGASAVGPATVAGSANGIPQKNAGGSLTTVDASLWAMATTEPPIFTAAGAMDAGGMVCTGTVARVVPSYIAGGSLTTGTTSSVGSGSAPVFRATGAVETGPVIGAGLASMVRGATGDLVLGRSEVSGFGTTFVPIFTGAGVWTIGPAAVAGYKKGSWSLTCESIELRPMIDAESFELVPMFEEV